jgi:uncharacterized YccA/Bax inhibitor family protein
MESSNPAFSSRAIDALRRSTAGSGTMTVGGTATKTLILLLVTSFSAGMVWTSADPATYRSAMLIGTIGGLVFALATSFKPQWAPITAPLYAVLEGLALGAISAIYNAQFRGLPMMAVAATMITAVLLFAVYRTGLIKVTDRMRAVAGMALLGLMGTYLVHFIMGFFGTGIPLINSSSMFGIGFSVLTTGLAAFFLLLDMDRVEQMARSGLPKSMEWYGAFAFLVTLVWLYLEMLRLLSKLQRR